jgi:hypothetical protein
MERAPITSASRVRARTVRSLRCRLGLHRWHQFLQPSLPDGSVWAGQLQRTCERCERREACYPTNGGLFDSDWYPIDRGQLREVKD